MGISSVGLPHRVVLRDLLTMCCLAKKLFHFTIYLLMLHLQLMQVPLPAFYVLSHISQLALLLLQQRSQLRCRRNLCLRLRLLRRFWNLPSKLQWLRLLHGLGHRCKLAPDINKLTFSIQHGN